MLFLHDAWVNWFEGEENGYNVCHAFEWRKEDGIELMDQMPIVYMDENTYESIENDMIDLPQELLDSVYKKSYTRNNQKRVPYDYSFIATDGNNIIAIDTAGYQMPFRKSRIIPRHERMVLELIEDTKPINYNLKSKDKEYHLYSLNPKHVYGLTRKERQLKLLLMMAIERLEESDNIHQLRYWLMEFDIHISKDTGTDEAWKLLCEAALNGWTDKHEYVCREMIKGQPFFEKTYELEVSYEGVNK